jgi:hypothetical protein
MGKLSPVLLVGQRTNVDSNRLNDTGSFLPSVVRKLAKSQGHLLHDNAQDYFIVYNHSFPWHIIPDVVIGRVAYDNFVVAKAIATDVSVIDVTKTVIALHQSDTDGDRAGHRTNITKKDYNKAVIGKFDYTKGRLKYTPYFTDFIRVASAQNSSKTKTVEVTSEFREKTNDNYSLQKTVGVFLRKKKRKISMKNIVTRRRKSTSQKSKR